MNEKSKLLNIPSSKEAAIQEKELSKLSMEEIVSKIRAGELDYEHFWICDYRRPDLNKKPIRAVKPTHVMVMPNSDLKPNVRIYYSESHFKPVSKDGSKILSKCIPIFDNTGYRAYTGVPLQVFRNQNDCIEAWEASVEHVIAELQDKKSTIIHDLQEQIDNLKITKSKI